jgi:DNA polymerase-3 subunit delta'
VAFRDFPEQEQAVRLLQRSLERGRLAHAYLFTGHHLAGLEAVARTLAKTLNCRQPARGHGRAAVDCCDTCLNCRKIDHDNHADVHWVRPESKLRVITIGQMRDLMQDINLKPTEAEYKVAVIVAADRQNAQAANAFLKTLEEPPARSVLILLSTEPQRMLETILSRCLRLNLAGEGARPVAAADLEWLGKFSKTAAVESRSLLTRYRLLDVLLQRLNGLKSATEEELTARSPLQRYDDAEKAMRDRWEEELTAAIEAEYRRQRADLLLILQRWLRDVWLQTLKGEEVQSSKFKVQSPKAETGSQRSVPANAERVGGGERGVDELLSFPQMPGAAQVGRRISSADALANLQILEHTQRLLFTNVQEALALEVGLLKLHL